MHAIRNKRCPAYLADVVQLVGMASTRTGLRSADSSNYSLPRLNARVGERAFSYAGRSGRLVPTTREHPPAANYTSFKRPRAGSGVVRMDPLRFLAGCRTRRLNQA